MNLAQLIEERESIRDYDPNRIIEKETLTKILEAGRLAPSAANRQPWEFLMISSEEMLEKIRKVYPAPWFKEAPHVLVVKGYKSKAWTRKTDGYNSLETDLTIAIDHMILMAEALGIGTCWIAAFDPTILRNETELSEDEEIFAITPLGYQHEGFVKKHAKIRKPAEEIYRFL